MIKDNVPAKPKFYALLLIKEMLETKDSVLVGIFTKKFKDRFYKLAAYKIKDSKLSFNEKGRTCLDSYYKNKSDENKKYSIMFFTLLWESWKHWDIMFSKSNKKLESLAAKLRNNFPKEDKFYDFLE